MKQFIFLFCLSLTINENINADFYESSMFNIEHNNLLQTNGAEKPLIKRTLLITGCARAGTHYITDLLNKCGLQVGHEDLGDDGTVAWQGVIDTNYHAFGWRYPDGKIKFKHIFHQIRDPLAVISSLYNRSSPVLNKPWARAWEYIEDHVPEIKSTDSLVVKCAKYWYYWNLEAEQRAEWTYRIEDIDIVLPEICERLGLEFNQRALDKIPKDTNHFEFQSNFVATWRVLKKELSPKLLKKIKEMAQRYDYPTND